MSGYRFTFFLLLPLLCTLAQADTLDTQRSEFMRAYSAVQHHKKIAADSKALKEYVLYPYLQAARLAQELQDKPADATLDKRIATFIDAQNTAPAVRDLRHAWLLSLATRNEWKTFLAHFRDDGDAELRCQNINALLAMHRDGEVPTLVAPLWMTGDRLAAACNPPFKWARDKQIITTAQLEQRIRLALKGGNTQLARDLVEDLPVALATPLLQWIGLIENPVAGIDAAITHPDINIETTALQDGWTRLARKDQDAAIARLPKLIKARDLSDSDASPFYLNLALALAWNRRSEALQYFVHVTSTDMTEQAYEWQARAALWRGDWQLVGRLINAMPTSLKSQVRWRYWLIRATERTQGIDAARAGYQQLVDTEDNYFAARAAARINARYAPHPLALNIDLPALQKLVAMPDMHRVRELFAVQLTPQATSEWNALISPLNNAELLAAAALAHEWGW